MTERGPTILQIIPELDTGGAELSTIEIADAIVTAGGRAIVLTQGGRMLDRLKAVGADVRVFPAATKNPARLAANAARIAQIIRAEGVDLVHARSRAPAWSALWAARATGRAFITTYHGAYAEKSAAKRFYNSVMARGDIVIANSGYTRDLIMGRYGTPDAKIRVVHRGVDGALFDPGAIAEDRVARLRAAWGLTGSERIILQAARLTAWKGQGVVVAAARHLKEIGRPLQAVIVLAGDDQGREGYAAGLRSAIAEGGLEGQVRLVGHVDDMPAAFKAAHLSIVASVEPEAFGRTAVESQALGCPVIATRIGAPQETVRAAPDYDPDARTGWLVPPQDPAALAAAMEEAMALDPVAREALGQRARTHALDAFSLRQMRLKTLAVYDERLGTHTQSAYVAARPQSDG